MKKIFLNVMFCAQVLILIKKQKFKYFQNQMEKFLSTKKNFFK